jgi:hypothetical protein
MPELISGTGRVCTRPERVSMKEKVLTLRNVCVKAISAMRGEAGEVHEIVGG